MADDKPLMIPIDSIEKDFNDFLSPRFNKRIIFSGPFGIGKTYFLDIFFENHNSIYFPVFLRPVDYSLLSNEDIFKLIKYDIIFQILKDVDISTEFEFSKLEYSLNFLNFNKYLILKNLLRHLPVIKQGIEIGQDMEKLLEVYQKGWKRINKTENESLLKDFYEASENHFLLEFDQVSKFIAEQLDSIAQKKGTPDNPAKKVLIIDDLDRLDPEHIFRLFNVFSAHLNNSNPLPNLVEVSDNKFGFDKIIFVCDIENIRKIFAHKYGEGVDFSGYIDKFYSSQIYHFNKDKSVQKYIKDIFKSYESTYPLKGGDHSSILSIVKLIFQDLIEAKCVNHRIINNITERKVQFREPYSISFWSPSYIRNYELIFIQVLDFLYDIFGKNYKALHEAIKKASELKKNSANRQINNHIIHLLPLLSLQDLGGNAQNSWRHPQNSNSISFQIEQGMDGLYYAKIKSSETSWMNYQNYYSLLLLVIENLKNIGVFELEPES